MRTLIVCDTAVAVDVIDIVVIVTFDIGVIVVAGVVLLFASLLLLLLCKRHHWERCQGSVRHFI